MAIRKIEAWQDHQYQFQIDYRWRYWNQISSQLFLALVAAEDQKFPLHSGIDFEAIQKALLDQQKNKRLRGASTITQQLAKNLYLWGERNYFRKALEAYFALLLECFLKKQRILEIYANVIEFGNGIYGAQAASIRFYGRAAKKLNKAQASRLAAVLPNPKNYRVNPPSPYVQKRSRWIRRQMTQLGGIRYLRKL